MPVLKTNCYLFSCCSSVPEDGKLVLKRVGDAPLICVFNMCV